MFCSNNKNKFFYISLKKDNITQLQVFVYDVFNIIAKIYIMRRDNKQKKYVNRQKIKPLKY